MASGRENRKNCLPRLIARVLILHYCTTAVPRENLVNVTNSTRCTLTLKYFMLSSL